MRAGVAVGARAGPGDGAAQPRDGLGRPLRPDPRDQRVAADAQAAVEDAAAVEREDLPSGPQLVEGHDRPGAGLRAPDGVDQPARSDGADAGRPRRTAEAGLEGRPRRGREVERRRRSGPELGGQAPPVTAPEAADGRPRDVVGRRREGDDRHQDGSGEGSGAGAPTGPLDRHPHVRLAPRMRGGESLRVGRDRGGDRPAHRGRDTRRHPDPGWGGALGGGGQRALPAAGRPQRRARGERGAGAGQAPL